MAASAVLCFCVLKIIGSIETDSWLRFFGDSEIRELYIAFFLSLYLVWLYFKLRSDQSSKNQVTMTLNCLNNDA